MRTSFSLTELCYDIESSDCFAHNSQRRHYKCICEKNDIEKSFDCLCFAIYNDNPLMLKESKSKNNYYSDSASVGVTISLVRFDGENHCLLSIH